MLSYHILLFLLLNLSFDHSAHAAKGGTVDLTPFICMCVDIQDIDINICTKFLSTFFFALGRVEAFHRETLREPTVG